MTDQGLPSKASIVIIGGGVAGASLAYRLAERGAKDVLLLEKGEIASGSSSKSAGILMRYHFNEPQAIVQRMGWELYEQFAKDGDIDLTPLPLVFPVRTGDPAELQDLLRDVATRLMPEMGASDTAQWLDGPDAVLGVNPCLKSADIKDLGDLVGAFYGPRDAWVDGYVLTTTYARHAEKLGVNIRSNVEVTDILVRDGRVHAVETSSGRVECEQVVCACGAWSARIGEMAGVEIPIKPVRRVLLTVQSNQERKCNLGGYLDTLEGFTPRMGLWIRSDAGGYVGGPAHSVVDWPDEPPVDPDDFNQNYEYEEVTEFAQKLEEFMPGFGEFEVVDGWAGLYELTPDMRPIIDKVESPEGFMIFAGFSGEGIHASGGASVLAAQLILDGQITAIPDPSFFGYTKERFANAQAARS